jgi:hypothetical protein
MPREPQRSNLVALLLVGAGVVAGGSWLSLRAIAQDRAEEAHDAANAIADCVDRKTEGRELGAALDLMIGSDRPFAECEVNVKALAAAGQALLALPLVGKYAPVVDLASVSARLTARSWNATASDIAKDRARATLPEDVTLAAELACHTAHRLGLDTSRDCVREPAVPKSAPPRRTAIDAATDDAQLGTIVAEAIDRDFRLFFVTRSALWLLASKDLGQTHRHETRKLPGKKRERELLVASGAEGRHYAVVWSKAEPAASTLFRVTKADRIELDRELDLPDDLTWSPAGAPVLEVHDGENLMLVLVLVTRQSARGRVAYLENKRLQVRKIPEGEFLGAVGTPPAILIGRKKKKKIEVASYAMPNAISTWPTPKVAVVESLVSVSGRDVACGAPKERYVPFLSRSEDKGTLIAVSDTEPAAYPFKLARARNAALVCGRCSPSLLSSSPKGLELFLSAERALTGQALATPLVFGEKEVWPTAQAVCAGNWLAFSWISQQRLFVQNVEVGTWQSSPPTLLAEPNEWGKPENVTLLATQSGVIVFWWRRGRPDRMRLEFASSKDGKTWT